MNDNQTDHDLLIRMDEKLELIIKDNKDHESRIRSLEQFRWQLVGGILVLNGVADYILYLALHK